MVDCPTNRHEHHVATDDGRPWLLAKARSVACGACGTPGVRLEVCGAAAAAAAAVLLLLTRKAANARDAVSRNA